MIQTPPQTRDPSPRTGLKGRTLDTSLTASAVSRWKAVRRYLDGDTVFIDGESLGIAAIIAVGKYGASARLSKDVETLERIEKSVQMLKRHLNNGHLVYGVTTGFGGSADTRTFDLHSLQQALIQHQNSGILTGRDLGRREEATDGLRSRDKDVEFLSNSMPTSWIRASMLTRCNSIIRGHSAVRAVVAETILDLLKHDITPVVPLRGSVSASGDLSPLSYIAGAIEGCPDIFVRYKDRVVSADQALREAKIAPVTLGPKEGLGLLNGTAFSAATASLALHQAQDASLLSQILTAMAVEAMQGSAESFWPEIGKMRRHPGQIESAANILSFLDNSSLARCVKAPKDTRMVGLYQDRYSLRTASQWIGPQLEDLLHAQGQLTVELNSTTDNPLIDVESDHILHGGNFQAAVVTSTMDRARMCIERLGKMLFSQATEMVNPAMNNGLPANLAADDPSLSFTCKGVDINMASYQSELGFLANPVGNHVQSAEMHNQSINSLALISSRKTMESLDVLYQMSSAHLFLLCQALDLGVLGHEFMLTAESIIKHTLQTLVGHTMQSRAEQFDKLFNLVFTRIIAVWPTTTTLDLIDRCEKSANATILDIVQFFAAPDNVSTQIDLVALTAFTQELKMQMHAAYNARRDAMFANHVEITTSYLGDAAKRMYTFVRCDLGVPLHRGLVEHPTRTMGTTDSGRAKKTIGSQVSVIYEALRDGRATEVIVQCAEEALQKRT